MEETHQKPPRTLVTVADDSSDSQGLEHTYCVHRELKRSGHAARLSVLMAKKGSLGPPTAQKPTALCFSRTSRDPDRCLEARLGSTCFWIPSPRSLVRLSIARTRHCCSIIRHGEPVLGHDISASRKPGKTCQHTVTWRVFLLPSLSSSQSAASPLFLTGQGTLNLLGRRGGGNIPDALPVQLFLFLGTRVCNLSFLSPFTLLSSWDKQSAPTLPLPITPPPVFPADRYSARPASCVCRALFRKRLIVEGGLDGVGVCVCKSVSNYLVFLSLSPPPSPRVTQLSPHIPPAAPLHAVQPWASSNTKSR